MTPQRAFTIVELLVVVAVIALLISVVVPAVASARGRGMQSVGQSNLRQLQIANSLYADANGERFVPAAVDFYPPPTVRAKENTHRWFGTRDSQSQPFIRQDGPIVEYLDSEGGDASVGVRRDPAFAGVLDELAALPTIEGGFEVGCGGYGYNAEYVGKVRERDKWGRWIVARRGNKVVGDDVGSLRSRFLSPSATVAFADAAIAKERLIEYAVIEPPFIPESPAYRYDPTVHFRHGGGAGRANVVWLDGHVSAEARSFTRDSNYYPAKASELGLGWFGDASSNALFDYQ